MKFDCNWPSSFWREVVWNCGRTTDRRTDDGRTTDDGACLYYKLPRSLRLRWAKKPAYLNRWIILVSDNSHSEATTLTVIHLFTNWKVRSHTYLGKSNVCYFIGGTTSHATLPLHWSVIQLRNNFSLPVNYRWLTHVVGGQITKY